MRRVSLPAAMVVAVLAAGCSDAVGPFDALAFERLAFDQFQQIIIAGATRVEVDLLPPSASGFVVAAQAAVRPTRVGADERIESHALRFDTVVVSATECRGTLVLAPNVAVSFNRSAEFDSRDTVITCGQFVARVQADLAAGLSPLVEAQRDPPILPQAPTDSTFAAAELDIEFPSDRDVELNVNAANLEPCSALPGAPLGCFAVLRMLNLPIVIEAFVTDLDPSSGTQFQQMVIGGATRLQVAMLPSSLSGLAVAEEAEIRSGTVERVRSFALRFDSLVVSATECRGKLVLAPTFAVSFDAAATFTSQDTTITCGGFVTRVQAALAVGDPPVVEADRRPPAVPQAPDDPTFVPFKLALKAEDDDGGSDPIVQLNVDPDNVQDCITVPGAPVSCFGVLRMLNVPIALVAGITVLER